MPWFTKGLENVQSVPHDARVAVLDAYSGETIFRTRLKADAVPAASTSPGGVVGRQVQGCSLGLDVAERIRAVRLARSRPRPRAVGRSHEPGAAARARRAAGGGRSSRERRGDQPVPPEQPVQVHPIDVRLARREAHVSSRPDEQGAEVPRLERLHGLLLGVRERHVEIDVGLGVPARGASGQLGAKVRARDLDDAVRERDGSAEE